MKIKLIAGRSNIGGYTVGKTYNLIDESGRKYFIIDDVGDFRFIGKSLRGAFWDWEIVEE